MPYSVPIFRLISWLLLLLFDAYFHVKWMLCSTHMPCLFISTYCSCIVTRPIFFYIIIVHYLVVIAAATMSTYSRKTHASYAWYFIRRISLLLPYVSVVHVYLSLHTFGMLYCCLVVINTVLCLRFMLNCCSILIHRLWLFFYMITRIGAATVVFCGCPWLFIIWESVLLVWEIVVRFIAFHNMSFMPAYLLECLCLCEVKN